MIYEVKWMGWNERLRGIRTHEYHSLFQTRMPPKTQESVCLRKTERSHTRHKFKKRFKVALGCMAIRTQNELMIRRVQFIRRTKQAATQEACAGNTRGYHSEYGNTWFNNRENDDAYYMFRSYNNCYYSSSEPVSDEEDES